MQQEAPLLRKDAVQIVDICFLQGVAARCTEHLLEIFKWQLLTIYCHVTFSSEAVAVQNKNSSLKAAHLV